MKGKHGSPVVERTHKPLAERYVSMSNALARSAHGLLLSEKRVVAMCLAKTDSMSSADVFWTKIQSGWRVHISVAEFAQEFDIAPETAYEQLKEATFNLRGRYIKTIHETPRGPKQVETNWCGQCTYHDGEGWAEISFTPEIAPHLLGLKTKFLSYKFEKVQALRSMYSWRLFECLDSWKDTGLWIVSIESFRHMMEVPESMSDFAQVRRRVIDPSISELREKNNLVIELELKKKGRKVTDLHFRFSQNPQTQLELV